MAQAPDPGHDALQQQLEEARDEAELNLLQLQQVQEELERHFSQSRSKNELFTKQQAQQLRMKKLISELLAKKN